MSRVVLFLPSGTRLTLVDRKIADLADALGCRVTLSTDVGMNRVYQFEPVYQQPRHANLRPLRPGDGPMPPGAA